MILGGLSSCYFSNLYLFQMWLFSFLSIFVFAGSDSCIQLDCSLWFGIRKNAFSSPAVSKTFLSLWSSWFVKTHCTLFYLLLSFQVVSSDLTVSRLFTNNGTQASTPVAVMEVQCHSSQSPKSLYDVSGKWHFCGKTSLDSGLRFLGGGVKIKSVITVITLPQGSVVLFPY